MSGTLTKLCLNLAKIKMKKLFLIIFLGLSFTGFAQKLNAEQTAVKQAATAFFNWYKLNWKKYNDADIYNSEKNKPSGPPYKILWKKVDQRFAWLRKNVSVVGDTFITYERKYYKYVADSNFTKYPKEEIAIGFDFDRIVDGQDDPVLIIKDYFSKKTKWKFEINKTSAIVTLEDTKDPEAGYAQKFLMTKEKGKWVMGVPPGMYFHFFETTIQ